MDRPTAREIVRADRPPPDPPIKLRMVYPEPGKDVVGIIVNPTIFGTWVHYYDDRDYPCSGNAETCEGCKRNRHKRWKGFLGCWDRNRGRLFVAPITAEAYQRCPGFESSKGHLRGLTVRLCRNGTARNSRVTATLSKWAGPIEQLPPAFSMETYLERLWFGGEAPSASQDDAGDTAAGQDGSDIAQPEMFDSGGPYAR